MRALLVLVSVLSAVTVVGSDGGVGHDRAAGEPSAALATSATDLDRASPRTGRLEIVALADGVTEAVGWVNSSGPVSVRVRSGATVATLSAASARLDVVAATGEQAWGFVGAVDLDGDVACLELAGFLVDCAWVGCAASMFGRGFIADLESRFRGARFTAYVVDERTGCTYALHERMRITTASVVKVEILGGLLLAAQRAERPLTVAERSDAEAMMRYSLNPETGVVWSSLGGVSGMERLDRRFGVHETAHAPAFGATLSTARDQALIAQAVLAGGGPLRWPAVGEAWDIMGGVAPAQQWGISAGVGDSYRVALKNGFYPLRGAGWRVGSAGYVADPDGGGYAIAVLTDNNDTQAVGVRLVERIARRVNRRLTAGPEARRSWDRVRCVTAQSPVRSWEAYSVALGLGQSRARAVQRAAGGDGPIVGQAICTP